jgi:multiple sugar transport system ATP-binding protein
MGQVSMRRIEKRFGDTEVIRGLNLEVRDGEFMVFVGPSGCGKSTMLRMIAGLESVTSGDLLIDGVRVNDLAPAERGTAMVFQNYALYPHMTVAENMGFSLRVAGVKPDAIRKAVEHAAGMLRLGELLKRYPRELSGGQRQRVAIGRAIVRKPRVFLFDEPLSNLDAALRVQMRIELSRLHAELKTTMIYVTHDQVEAMTMGNRIAVFSGGVIAQVGTPLDVYFNPSNEFVASFIGSPRINLLDVFFDGVSLKVKGAPATLAPPPDLKSIDSQRVARLGVRAEHLRLDATDGIPGEVVLSEHLGSEIILYVKVDGLADILTVKVAAGGKQPAVGDHVSVVLSHALYFDQQGRRIARRDDALPE